MMMTTIQLQPITADIRETLKKELQAAFMKGLKDCFNGVENPMEMGIVPSEEDYKHALYGDDVVIRQLMLDGKRIGGVVLKIDEDTQRNEVEFFYICEEAHGQGLGTRAWQAIEKAFPHTKVWELYTPYFEKRNIHFYVNKCGFHIVEFQHKGNPGPNVDPHKPTPDEEYEFFRFEKVMPTKN